MKKSRFTETSVSKEADAGMKVEELCRARHQFRKLLHRKKKYGGMDARNQAAKRA